MQTITKLSEEAIAILENIPAMSDQANNGCGQVYELYVKRFSFMVDAAIRTLPIAEQSEVIAQIKKKYEYWSSMEVEEYEELESENGFCAHGLDELTCPCGCFEHDYYIDETPEPELTHAHLIEIILLQAKIDICEKTLSALAKWSDDSDAELQNYQIALTEQLRQDEAELACIY